MRGEAQFGDDELPVFLLVVVVDGMVAQLEGGAGRKAANDAFAVETLCRKVSRLLAQGGIAFQFVGIGAVIGRLRQIAAQSACESRALFPVVDAAICLRGEGGYRQVIPRLQGSGALHDLARAFPGGDRVFRLRAVGAMEADDRTSVVIETIGIVKQHQGVLRRFIVGAVERETIRNAFLGQQAGDESEIALAVLQAVRPRRIVAR